MSRATERITRRRLLAATGLAGLAASSAVARPLFLVGGAPRATASVENVMTLRNRSGVAQPAYPLKFGRAFMPGEIANAPRAIVGGSPLATQANVKRRHPDGSVQYAVIAVDTLSLPAAATPVEVRFGDQPETTVPLSGAAMLDAAYDFDCVMELVFAGPTATASARAMLAAGHYRVIDPGPIAQTIELGDDTPARTYDIGDGTDAYRPFRPRFYATFYPASHRVRVRWVGENGLSNELKDLYYALTIKAGSAAPATVYSIDLTDGANNKFHWSMSNVTGRLWLGAEPEQDVDIDYNLPYLRETKVFPNYDVSLSVPETAIADMYDNHTGKPHDLYDGAHNGGLLQSGMSATGARYDIAPYPAWSVLWLYTGDHRMREMCLNLADVASAWSVNLREMDPTKNLDRDDPPGAGTGYGRAISIGNRPTYLSELPTYASTLPADRVTIVSALAIKTFTFDGAHQPAYFYPQYILTGDPYYKQMMFNWAGWSAALYNGAASTLVYGRGPTGAEGVINGQVRDAWTLRNRIEAARAADDADPEKAWLDKLTVDALARWEGSLGITGTTLDGHPVKAWGALRGNYYTNAAGSPPLHNWESNPKAEIIAANESAGDWVPGVTAGFTSLWMEHYKLYVLGRTLELGYPAGPLLDYSGRMQTDIILHSGLPEYMVAYQTPIAKTAGGYFATWQEIFTGALTADYLNNELPPYFDANQHAEGRHVWATPGLSYLVGRFPDAAAAWGWWVTNVYNVVKGVSAPPGGSVGMSSYPNWAIVPRT